jgi:uncharacterized protein (TIGR01777 family)
MHVVIGGGSGFIGTALAHRLSLRGDSVTIISRTPGPGRITWEDIARSGLPPCDAVVNLAGQHILDVTRRWNDAYKQEVLRSRVDTTRSLVQALNSAQTPPAVFVSTAGKCFYGTALVSPDDKYPELDENSSPMGMDFPAELVAQWEQAAEGVDTHRIRHVRVRIGVVLGAIERKSLIGKLWRIGKARGFLPIIRLPFCLGMGATLGHGRQPFPWIHIDDMTGLLMHLIDTQNASGRFNAVAPGLVSNREFTQEFSRRLHRPITWSAPAWLIRRMVGTERASILLEGQNVKPKRTLESGYRFQFPDIASALDDLVKITV